MRFLVQQLSDLKMTYSLVLVCVKFGEYYVCSTVYIPDKVLKVVELEVQEWWVPHLQPKLHKQMEATFHNFCFPNHTSKNSSNDQ